MGFHGGGGNELARWGVSHGGGEESSDLGGARSGYCARRRFDRLELRLGETRAFRLCEKIP